MNLEELVTKAEVLNQFFTSLIQQVQAPRPLAEKLRAKYKLSPAYEEQFEDIVTRVEKCKKIIDGACAEYGLDGPNQLSSAGNLLEFLSSPQNHLKEYYVKAHSVVKRHTFALVLYVPKTCFVPEEPAYTPRYFHYNPQKYPEKGLTYFKHPVEELSQYLTDPLQIKKLLLESLSPLINQEYAYTQTALHHELRHVVEGFIQCRYASELPEYLYTMSFNELKAAGINHGIKDEIRALKRELYILLSGSGFSRHARQLRHPSANFIPELVSIQEEIRHKKPFGMQEEVLLQEYNQRFDLIKMLTESRGQIHTNLEYLHGQGLSYEALSFVLSLTPTEQWPRQLQEIKQELVCGKK